MSTTRTTLLILASILFVGAFDGPESAGGFSTIRKIEAANVATKEIAP